MPLKNDRYTYLLTWSEDEYVGSCIEFPSLSCLDKTPEAALKGIRENVQGIIKDMRQAGEETPGPIAFMKLQGGTCWTKKQKEAKVFPPFSGILLTAYQ